ncbi:MAG TPA: SRPBCC family protein [Streptosporangiaceae bacterium]|jgi:uncharacterized protein YndB with AHSA1/START domain
MNAPGKPGTLEEAGDGRWRLRFTRQLAHRPEKVWRAITEPGHLRAWFPQRVSGEWVTGGKLTFSSAGGGHPDFHGEVLTWAPPSVLEFSWGTDVIRMEVAPAGDGGCTLTLLDTFAELGKAARDAAGWHECLDHLAGHLGGAPPSPPGQRWAQVHPGYVESLGPAAAAIGPPGSDGDVAG